MKKLTLSEIKNIKSEEKSFTGLRVIPSSEKVTAYKLFRKMKDGSYSPLFIGKRERYALGETLECNYNYDVSGFKKRFGWHGAYLPSADHLNLELKTGEKRVWLEVNIHGWVADYKRPKAQGGLWFTCEYLELVRELTSQDVIEILK